MKLSLNTEFLVFTFFFLILFFLYSALTLLCCYSSLLLLTTVSPNMLFHTYDFSLPNMATTLPHSNPLMVTNRATDFLLQHFLTEDKNKQRSCSQQIRNIYFRQKRTNPPQLVRKVIVLGIGDQDQNKDKSNCM